MTEAQLTESKEFKMITGNVSLIHECQGAYIVVHSTDNEKYTITRFVESDGQIQVSEDHNGLSTSEMFSELTAY